MDHMMGAGMMWGTGLVSYWSSCFCPGQR
jgi:hypothetical protein